MRILWPILLPLLLSQQQGPGVRVLGEAVLQAPSEMYVVAFKPDGRLLAAGMAKQGIVVWDIESKKEIQKIAAGDWITDLRFVLDGTSLVSMTNGEQGQGTMTLWNLAKNEKVWTTTLENYLGRLEISSDEKTLLTTGGAGVRCWDLKTGKELNGLGDVARSVENVQYAVEQTSLSADGTRIACLDTWRGTTGQDTKADMRARVSIWDFKNRKKQSEWLVDRQSAGWGGDLRWLPDGEHLLLSSGRRSSVFKVDDGKAVCSFEGRAIPDEGVTRAFTLQGKECTTWDLKSGAKVGAFPIGPVKNVLSGRVSKDGRWLAAATMSQTAVLVDLKEKAQVSPVDGAHQRQPAGLTYSADGRLLVFDGASTHTYDETGRRLQQFVRGWYCVDASDRLAPDGRKMLLAGGENGRAELWDTVRGERLGRLDAGPGRSGGVQAIYLSQDCKWAATVREGTGLLQFHDLGTGQRLGSLKGPTHGFFGPVMHLFGCKWNSLGDRVYLACENTGWFMGEEPKSKGTADLVSLTGVFDPKEGKLVFQFKDADGTELTDAQAIALHEASDLVYLGGKEFNGLWKASDGKRVRGIGSPGSGARFSADGKWLIGNDAIVDVATGKVERELKLGTRRVTSPSGTLYAAIDDTTTIRIYDTKTEFEVARREIAREGKILDVTWHPSEMQFATVIEKRVAAFQVELVARAERPAATADSIKTHLEVLSGKDVAKRCAAVSELVGGLADPASFALFKAAVEAERSRRDLPRLRMMVQVLEALGQRDYLESLTKETTDSPLGGMAREAVQRMKAGAEGAKLRAAYEKAEPIKLEWKD